MEKSVRSIPWPTYDKGNVFVDDEDLRAPRRALENRLYFRYDYRQYGDTETGRFETALRRYLGVDHALAVSSGTTAIALGLMSLRLEPGAVVACPGFTFAATPSAILLAGCRPLLIECDHNLHLDVADLARKMTGAVRAIWAIGWSVARDRGPGVMAACSLCESGDRPARRAPARAPARVTMELSPTRAQQRIQRTARGVADRLLAPRATARDASGEFPVAELRELGRLGLLGITVPGALGGAGAGTVAYALALQELARGDASVALLTALTSMVAELIATRGSPALAATWVPRLVSGELVSGAFALSEPDAGSDPSAIRTLATRVAGGWRISGTKQWVTAGDRAGCIIVWALTQPPDPARPGRGITAFVVPGGAPGITVARLEDKLGLRGTSTAQLVLDAVEVGDDAVLGAVGGGFALAMVALDGGRIGIASQAIGIARGALDAALRHARARRTFGRPIIEHQAVGAMLADAATWLDAAILMTLRAAQLQDARASFSQQAAMAKLFATEHAWKICDIALQVHGGSGSGRDLPIERALHDVRVTRIYEGASEIQRLVIARNLSLALLR